MGLRREQEVGEDHSTFFCVGVIGNGGKVDVGKSAVGEGGGFDGFGEIALRYSEPSGIDVEGEREVDKAVREQFFESYGIRGEVFSLTP